jgi:hypothetical protein
VAAVRERGGERSEPWTVAELEEYAATHELPVVGEAVVDEEPAEAEG